MKLRLQRASEAASRLDEEMSEIRGEIQEAQAAFSRKKKRETASRKGGNGMKFAVSSKGDEVSDTLKSKIQAYLLDFDMTLMKKSRKSLFPSAVTERFFTHFTGTATVLIKRRLSEFTRGIWVLCRLGSAGDRKARSGHCQNAVSYRGVSPS